MQAKYAVNDVNIVTSATKESGFDVFAKCVLLLFNIISTLLSLGALILMAVLRLKDNWVMISLGVLLALNLGLSLVMFFTYSVSKKSAVMKISKIAIKALRLLVSFINMALTIVMWFTTYSNSPLMTVMLIIFTGFYGVVIVFQLFVIVVDVALTIVKKKRKAIIAAITRKKANPQNEKPRY